MQAIYKNKNEWDGSKRTNSVDICCGNHLSQRQMIIQAVNFLSWISSGKFTRELDKESLLN